MTIISAAIEAVPRDKLMQFSAGAGLYLSMTALEYYNIYHFRNKLLMVFLVGLSKEVHDYIYPEYHTASGLDVIATLAGGFVMYSVLRW